MNTVMSQAAASAPPAAPDRAELVDFKWLMLAEGHGIDLERLQTDRAYARGCLALAGGSTSTALRCAAELLGQHLRVTVPRA